MKYNICNFSSSWRQRNKVGRCRPVRTAQHHRRRYADIRSCHVHRIIIIPKSPASRLVRTWRDKIIFSYIIMLIYGGGTRTYRYGILREKCFISNCTCSTIHTNNLRRVIGKKSSRHIYQVGGIAVLLFNYYFFPN